MSFVNKFLVSKNGKIVSILIIILLGMVAFVNIDLTGTGGIPTKKEPKGTLFTDKKQKSNFETFDAETVHTKNSSKGKSSNSSLNLQNELPDDNNPLGGIPDGSRNWSVTPEELSRFRERYLAMENKYTQLLLEREKNDDEEKTTVKIPSMSSGYKAPPVAAKPLVKSARFAPYGRFLKCRLINSIDSSNLGSPIIAVVEEDVIHNGLVVIPKGTEVTGESNQVHLRDRITADKDWNLIFSNPNSLDNGKELPIKARALNREILKSKAGDKITRYGFTDGTLGIKGRVIETDEYLKIKKGLMSIVKGASEGFYDILEDQNTDNSNSIDTGNEESRVDEEEQFKGAAAGGIREFSEDQLAQMEEEIKENGRFVRVTGGKQFYLFVDQTIDMAEAKIGGTIIEKEVNETGTLTQEEQLSRLTNIMLRRAENRNNNGVR